MVLLLTALALTAMARGGDRTRPVPDDPRCGRFGYARSVPMPLIPVAWPLIQDLSRHGELEGVTERLSRAIANDLGLSGVFLIRSRESRPTSSMITWNSALAFDYLGWRQARAWMVVVGEVAPNGDGNLRVRLDGYLTEEADILGIGNAEKVLSPANVEDFGHQYVNALLQCITGLSGTFGSRITYSHRPRAGAAKEIFFVEFGSTDPVQVSRDGSVAMLPAWAPGGGIAFTGFQEGNPDVYLADCPGCPQGGVRQLSARQGMNSGIAFSPRGGLAALTMAPDGNPDIYLIDGKTGDAMARLTTSGSIDTSPAWSPDGRRIAFVSDRRGSPQIWVMNSDGTEQRPLPLSGSYNTSPDWSPDGAEIVYQCRVGGRRFTIKVYNLLTGAVRVLTRGASSEEPSWSPDARMIVYTHQARGPKELWMMTRDGTGARPLLDGPGEYFTPAWERPFSGNR
ncbi:MAG: PD40 domain-containing protein [Deltaproteobacteria bacterium]|nr:PD40 domain-containing protein [Deltaproteobacteria bacterium]